jgi:recombination protein RecT
MNTALAETGTATKIPAPIVQIRDDLKRMETQFASALPAHIPVERFTRVVMTAVQNNTKLLACDRQSFFNACMRAAQDGLLPDGREGAIVPFGDEDDGARKSDKASWMPMIAGLRKKARNSGELLDWHADVVFEGDEFDYQKGDDPHIVHRPALTGGRTRKIIAAYSIAKFPDGSLSREVMTIDEIEDVRKRYSRAKKGPWSDPIAYPEMCRKTVARLHSKQLPMSTDLDTLMHRDDELYDLKRAAEDARAITGRRPSTIAAAFDHFAGNGAPQIEGKTTQQPPDNDKPAEPPKEDPKIESGPQPKRGTKVTELPPPKNPAEYMAFAKLMIDSEGSTEQLKLWFKSEGQIKLRNACGVTREEFEEISGWISDKLSGQH